MPRTKFQSFIFTIMMVFCMVYAMTCYTICQKSGVLTYEVFSLAFYCFPAALCLQVFFIGPFVRMLFRTIFKKQLQA